jgi:hypothetical protein
MKRVLVLVEGQTEERFIKDLVCPHLWEREIIVTPTISTTKRVKRGADFKGGITDYQKVRNDVQRLLRDSDVSAVTTFIDYYGLPTDFPGMRSRPPGNSILKAIYVEEEWKNLVANERFRPYLMIHEFEALLFSNPEELSKALNQPAIRNDLATIRASFPSPEDINESPETTPSRRIISISPGYRKAFHGPMVASRIGLQTIREQCAHFSDWLNWIEVL